MSLSATLPGLGQIYTGHETRGVLFMASVLGALGGAYAAYKPADLALADYDAVQYGGTGDGLISTIEAQNWQDRKYQAEWTPREPGARRWASPRRPRRRHEFLNNRRAGVWP